MNNQLKIILYLMENKENPSSINAIAKKLNLNYKIAFEETKKLQSYEIASIKKIGNANLCTFNYTFNEKILAAENKKKEDILKNKNLKILYNRLLEIKNPFFICLLFGSYAKLSHNKNSDIDLCVITENQEIKQQIGQILRILPLEVHLLEFTPAEFISMLKTTEDNVGKEIIKNNIIFKGAESFYELINRAK